MDYTELSAAELKALCIKKGIKPSRAKADMIEDLKARDAADELTVLSQELDLPDEPMPTRSPTFGQALEAPVEPVQESEVSVDLPAAEKPTERPVETLATFPWVEDGLYLLAFPRRAFLDMSEHEFNLQQVAGRATSEGFETYGPPYRVHSRTQPDFWVYGINVR